MSLDTLITVMEMNSAVVTHGKMNGQRNGHSIQGATNGEKLDENQDDSASSSSGSGSSYTCTDDSCSSESSDEEPNQPVNHIDPENRPSTGASGRYHCLHCKRTFLWADAYKTHLATHTSDKPHVCTICDKTFQNATNLARHMKSHDTTGTRCFTCGFQASGTEELAAHLKTHSEEPEEEIPLETPLPPKSDDQKRQTRSSNNPELQKHRRAPVKRKAPSPIDMEPEEDPRPPNQGKYVCKFCKMKFAWGCTYRRHLRTHTGERPYSCQICEKSFKTLNQLKQHGLVHSDDKPYPCDEKSCKKRFKTLNQMKSHVVMHTGEKPYACDICGACFPRKHTVTKHKRTHTGEKPYRCKYCDLTFAYSDRMKEHMKSHNPEEQNLLSCDECGKRFTHKRNLRVHLRIHTGVRKYKCELCPKTFIQASGRSRHMKSHTGDKPHLCESCGLRFAYPSEVIEHVKKIHNGEKRHQCDTCQKFFHSVRDLRRHIRTHTGEKPYTCDVCQKSFTQSYTLKIHLRLHTGDKPVKKRKEEEETKTPPVRPAYKHPKVTVQSNPKLETAPLYNPPLTTRHNDLKYEEPSQVKLPPASEIRLPPIRNVALLKPYNNDLQIPRLSNVTHHMTEEYSHEPMRRMVMRTVLKDDYDTYVDSPTHREYDAHHSNTTHESLQSFQPSSFSSMDEYTVPGRHLTDDQYAQQPHHHHDNTAPVTTTTMVITATPNHHDDYGHHATLATPSGSIQQHDEYQDCHTPQSVQHEYSSPVPDEFRNQLPDSYPTENVREFDTRESDFEPGQSDFEPGQRQSDFGVHEECLSGSELTSHIRLHQDSTPYRCEGCGQGFETSSDLLDHLKAHIDAELAGIN